jgi:hypothetical protein
MKRRRITLGMKRKFHKMRIFSVSENVDINTFIDIKKEMPIMKLEMS